MIAFIFFSYLLTLSISFSVQPSNICKVEMSLSELWDPGAHSTCDLLLPMYSMLMRLRNVIGVLVSCLIIVSTFGPNPSIPLILVVFFSVRSG